MFKYGCLLLSLFILTGCEPKNDLYFRLHPAELETAIKKCPNTAPALLSCNELSLIAQNVNHLAYNLQMNQQGFGRRILALQMNIANQKQDAPDLIANQQRLNEYLAIVKWLMAPEA